ncbi:TMEM165/GDT1 family protein [Altericroceibacterium xinjiangense]|uniref:TMEM165/GDT1 family protein n=1 Tax=Altericroceibacterium xinjiangense TaxID=762261 RepID=UPI000F7F81DE|nr:TMEM165/GDT1 family protein [Altericroceibacterium xinjiangense]
MDAFLTSTALVALAEIGDKTQLLALVLTARFRKPLPIVCGILVATLENHALASWAGAEVAQWLDGPWFSAVVAFSFIAMGLWALVPDKLDQNTAARPHGSAFLVTSTSFFLAEMGDKTQLATVALGARFEAVGAVTAGTTIGMLLANVPVVFLGEKIMRRIPLQAVRVAAATLFLALGLLMLARGAMLQPSMA